MTQMSSMQRAELGIDLADLDAALAVALRAKRRRISGAGVAALASLHAARAAAGRDSLVRAGLGSKVSTCDGPPFMNRKMTRLARGGKCGGFGASGFGTPAPGPTRQPACVGKTLARPSAPKPPPMRQSTVAGETVGRVHRDSGMATLVT